MRIFLIRHGLSEGQVDQTAYARLMDHNVPLVDIGHDQAIAAGIFLKKYLEDNPSQASVSTELSDAFRLAQETSKPVLFFSPFLRTRQTKDGFLKGFGETSIRAAWEDFLLREQNFGLFSHISDEKEQEKKFPEEYKKYKLECQFNGKFYAVPHGGESRADVALRARIFIETMMRDVARGTEDIIIVAHGVSVRAIEMAFMHRGVEWFESEPNPGNCDITMIEGSRDRGYRAEKIYTGLKPEDLKNKPSPGLDPR